MSVASDAPEQLEPERLDPAEDPMERRLVGEHAPEHCQVAASLGPELGEGVQHRLAKVAADEDLVARRRRRTVRHAPDRAPKRADPASPEPGEPASRCRRYVEGMWIAERWMPSL